MIYEPSLFTAFIQDYLKVELQLAMVQAAFGDTEYASKLARQVDRQYAVLKYNVLYPFADFRLDYGA